MKKSIQQFSYLCIALGYSLIAKGQYENMQLPKFLPPPPNAFQITKTADVKPGLHTGTVNVSIPLFEITAGGKKIPLQLNYSSNGVTVDEIPSRTGINWTFNAGGVITRTVMDDDDEYIPLRTPPTDINNYNQLAEYVYPMVVAGGGSENGYNTQPDEYRFNVGELSGKFFYDHTGALKLSSFSDIKIEKNTGNTVWKFKLISPEGVAYYFGGPGATEESKYENLACNPVYYNQYSPVAWYLNKMEFPNGESIIFNYTPCNFSYIASTSQTFVFISVNNANVNTCQSRILQNGVVLQSIVCSNGTSVNFSYANREDVIGEKALQNIDRYYNGQIVNRYKLIYEYSNSNGNYEDGYYNSPAILFGRKRLFLTEVQNQGKQGTETEATKILYNDFNGLPPRLSTAQDHFGYFNGKHNLLYVPGLSTSPDPFSINTDWVNQSVLNNFRNAFSNNFNDSKEPDSNYSSKGTLQKIIYPTGGFTSIEWEPNTVNKFISVPPNPVSTTITALGTCHLPVSTCSSTVTRNFTLAYTQAVSLSGSAGRAGDDHVHSSMLVNIINTATNSSVYSKTLKFNESFSEEVTLPGGVTYQVKLTSTTNEIPSSLTYIYRPGNIVSGEYNIPVPGLRVKRITDFDGIAHTNIKKYNYHALATPTQSSGQGLQIHYHNTFTQELFSGHKLQNSSLHRSFLSGNNINYTQVVESLGNNYENGAIEHTYRAAYNGPGQPLYGGEINHAPFSDEGNIMNGLELENKVYQNKSGQLLLTGKTVNEYSADARNAGWYNCLVLQSRSSSPQQYTPPSNPSNLLSFDILAYRRHSSWVHLNKTTNYVYNENNNELTTVKTITYDNPQHTYPGTETTTIGNGQSETTVYKYVKDYSSLTNLSASTINAANLMISKNIVSPLLEKTISKEGTLLIRNRTDYNIWNGNMALPEIMSSNYNNSFPLKPRIRFYKYDAAGNTVEIAKENDVHFTYLWGYNNLYPVAEAQNAAKEEIFYTSFEEGSFGVADNNAKTGDKVAWGNYTVDFSLPNSKQYLLSYHVWNGSTWNYVQQPYTGAVTISGTKIDEVRIYPKDMVSMTTYTYLPLVGMSSACDMNGIVTYYEYNDFNRLKLIRDADRNIIKQLEYQYKMQPPAAVYYNTAQQGTFQRNNCNAGETGSQVIYTVAAGSYSSVISQADANQQAMNDVNQNGQAYANANGTCIPDGHAIIYSSNSVNVSGFTATFTHTVSGQQYPFPIPAAGGQQVLGYLPIGTYNITISKPGNTTEYGMGLSTPCNLAVYGSSATFTNVSVSSGSCDHVFIANWDLQ